MRALTKYDFDMVNIGDGDAYYLSYKNPKHSVEICLEPCLNGFDVALYKITGTHDFPELLYPKICTDIDLDSFQSNRVRYLAAYPYTVATGVSFANILIQRYMLSVKLLKAFRKKLSHKKKAVTRKYKEGNISISPAPEQFSEEILPLFKDFL